MAIENKVITKQIGAAQRRVEGTNFDVRKSLLDYDDVLREQREIIYEQRNYILENDDVHSIVKEMYERLISNTVASHNAESLDLEGLVKALRNLELVDLTVEDFQEYGRRMKGGVNRSNP